MVCNFLCLGFVCIVCLFVQLRNRNTGDRACKDCHYCDYDDKFNEREALFVFSKF